MDYVSTSIGTLISAPLFANVGYSGVFGCSTSCCFLALIYLVSFVKESLPSPNQRISRTDTESESVPETPLNTTQCSDYGSQNETRNNSDENTNVIGAGSDAKTNFIKTSLMFIFSSLKTIVQPRDSFRRAIVLLGVSNFMFYIFTYNGTEGTHRYLFAQNKYDWNEQNMASYLFNYRISYLVGLWIILPIITNIFKISDNMIGVIASTISAVGFIIPAVTPRTKPVWFRIGSFICLLSPINTIITRYNKCNVHLQV